jgi:hypothetical protein
MKRFSFFVMMAVMAVPALLTGCNFLGDFFGGNEEEPDGGGGGAASVINVGRSDIPEGPGWSYDAGTGVFTIEDGANVIVTGTTNANRVVVAAGASATVTLSDVMINMSGVTDAPAFDVSNTTVKLVLAAGSLNFLWSNGAAAGLQAPLGSRLTITSAAGDGSESGVLYAYGGQNKTGARGAGIGGGTAKDAGVIIILGGTIKAYAGYDNNGSGAGIGGGGVNGTGQGGSGGIITISGGNVTAYGRPDGTDEQGGGAGIGGGGTSNLGGYGGSITISGGVVTAKTGGGAGIGGGNNGSGGTIDIKGGTVTAESSVHGAGIGGGNKASGGIITISGGTVTASAANGAGIGSGGGGSGVSTITISGGFVTARAKDVLPSIGGFTAVIAIEGGVVIAEADGLSEDDAGEGAITGGTAESSISISGGTIIGTGSGIGKWLNAHNAPTLIVPAISNAVIFATDGSITSAPDNGIAIGDEDVNIDPVDKKITLKDDFTIPMGATLTVPPGWTLDCGGKTLTKNGNLVALGNIIGP